MKQQSVEVVIEKFGSKGNGLAQYIREDGVKLFVEVPFSMPGERVKATLLRKKKGVWQSRLDEVLEPSQERITPLCVHFGVCGGCRWQHMQYRKQLELKEEAVRKDFIPLLPPGVHMHPIIPGEPWQYRNKMEFTFSMDKEKKPYLGLIIEGSRGRVLNLSECHLVNSWFVHVLKAVRHWWGETDLEAFHPHRGTGSLRTLTLREGIRTGDKMVILTVSGNPDYALHQYQIDGFMAYVRDVVEPYDPTGKLSIFLRIHQAIKGRQTQFFEMHLYGPDQINEELHTPEPMTFAISPAAFFQPNTLQAETLYSRALDLAEIPNGAVIYDLYCGTGTIGLYAAKRAKKVIGIELSPEAVLDARANAEANKIDNYTAMQGDAHQVLQILMNSEDFERPDAVIVDPPRSGLGPEGIKQLISLKSEKIIYISCNPASQAKDCGELVKGGYAITALQPVDQFPQTVHIENIAVLKWERR